VYVPAAAGASYRLVLRAAPFCYPGGGQQRFQVIVNGSVVASTAMAADYQEYAVEVPAGALHRGPNTVELRFAYAVRPSEVVPGAYAIGSTGATAPTHLEVHSVGDIAYITIGTVDGSRHATGLNVATFDVLTGALRDKDVFSWDDGAALEAFLAAAGAGTGVAVAVQGGVPATVGPAVCAGLVTAGAGGCPAEGAGYALIGVVGAPPGAALQASGDDAYLVISPDDRRLSAAVDWVRWQRRQ